MVHLGHVFQRIQTTVAASSLISGHISALSELIVIERKTGIMQVASDSAIAPFFGFMGASSALVFSCKRLHRTQDLSALDHLLSLSDRHLRLGHSLLHSWSRCSATLSGRALRFLPAPMMSELLCQGGPAAWSAVPHSESLGYTALLTPGRSCR